MALLQIEEGRLQTDLKLLSTIIWSAAVFELFKTPVYKRLTHMLSEYKHLNKDAESVRRVQEVRFPIAAVSLMPASGEHYHTQSLKTPAWKIVPSISMS